MNSRWAVAQVDAGSDLQENLDVSLQVIREAADASCRLIAFPEFFLIRGDHDRVRENVLSLESPPVQSLCRAADKHGIHILAGSLPTPHPTHSDFVYNTSIHINAGGQIAAEYRKIHLFDVDLKDVVVRESDFLKPGDEVVDIEVEGIHCGLSICYDLRFPELYRRLSDLRVEVVFVPSNFTRETGRAHWEPLLRARAIENQCYMVAPNQIGPNPDTGLPSLGQSMVVDPWGQVVARASDRPCWFSFDLNLDYLKQVRRQLPVLDHIELR